MDLLRGTDDSTQILAMGTHTTGPNLYYLRLTGSGLLLENTISRPAVAQGFSPIGDAMFTLPWPENFLYVSGRIYFSNGVVLNAADRTRLGCLPGGCGAQGRIVVDLARNQASFWSDTLDQRICSSDLRSYTPLASQPTQAGPDDLITGFIACGSGLVAASGQDNLYLLHLDKIGTCTLGSIQNIRTNPTGPQPPGTQIGLKFDVSSAWKGAIRGVGPLGLFPVGPDGTSPSVDVAPQRTTTYTVAVWDTMGLSTTQDVTIQVAGTTPLAYLDLPIMDLVASKTGDVLYASIGSMGGKYANSIVAIDPTSRSVENSIFVGSEPQKLALSEDGTTLYVNLFGAGTICPVQVPSMTLGAPFSLGSDHYYGMRYADDICPVPGQNGSVIISHDVVEISPRFVMAAAYDYGIPRVLSLGSNPPGSMNVIQPSSTPGEFFGFDNETTGSNLARFSLTPNGLTILNYQPSNAPIFFEHFLVGFGRIFFSDGTVLDENSLSVVRSLGVMNPNTYYPAGWGPIALDVANHQVFLTDQNGTIYIFDAISLAPAGSFNFGDSLSEMVRYGNSGLAVLTLGRLYFLDTGLFH
jgi:hypothetical protein